MCYCDSDRLLNIYHIANYVLRIISPDIAIDIYLNVWISLHSKQGATIVDTVYDRCRSSGQDNVLLLGIDLMYNAVIVCMIIAKIYILNFAMFLRLFYPHSPYFSLLWCYWLVNMVNFMAPGKRNIRKGIKWPIVAPSCLTLKHRETHGCVVSTVATDALVLKHQAISILSTD